MIHNGSKEWQNQCRQYSGDNRWLEHERMSFKNHKDGLYRHDNTYQCCSRETMVSFRIFERPLRRNHSFACASSLARVRSAGPIKSELIRTTPRAYASSDSPVASGGALSNRKKQGILRMACGSGAFSLTSSDKLSCVMMGVHHRWNRFLPFRPHFHSLNSPFCAIISITVCVTLSVVFVVANQLSSAAIIASAVLSAMMTMTTKKHHHKHRHVLFSKSKWSIVGGSF